MATLSYLSCPHFPGNRQRRFPGKWGRVEGGGLVAATCIPDRDKENVQLLRRGFKGKYCSQFNATITFKNYAAKRLS